MSYMEDVRAPGFSRERVEYLRKAGYLSYAYGADDATGELVPMYYPSEAAIAELDDLSVKHGKEAAQKREQKADKERAEAKRRQERLEDYANEERRYRTQNKIAIVMPFVTFALGMIVEYHSGIIGWVHALFSG